MEFKGTKGDWKPKLHNGNYYKIINENNEVVCNINSKSTMKIQEERANAQIISCAPEMLDMLNKVVDIQDKYFGDGIKTHLAFKKISVDIEELITKATTI